MLAKRLFDCSQCGEAFCMHCSNALDWMKYCSKECENKARDKTPETPHVLDNKAKMVV